jgi:alpha-tubulin suppressor-like RCC1 family protein
VFCWGDNTRRQLARSTTEAIGAPAEASLGSEPLVRTAAGTYSAFGISTAGDVRVWGAVAGNDGCTSARTASIDRDPNPTSIGLGPVTSLSVSSTTVVQAVSYAHACAVVAGDVLCWGQSAWGALGTGLPGGVVTPTRALVRSKTAWAQRVAAGGETTCVRLTDGKVECTGKNVHGALGRDTKDTFSMFFEPADAFTGYAVSVAVSQSAVCALQKEGRVACWGSNEHGELGQGTTDLDSHSTPLSVEF